MFIKSKAEAATPARNNNLHKTTYQTYVGKSSRKSSAFSLAARLAAELEAIQFTLLNPHLRSVERGIIRRLSQSTFKKIQAVA